MRILITGANGMVGKCLKKLIPEAVTPNSKELDLTDRQKNLWEKYKEKYRRLGRLKD